MALLVAPCPPRTQISLRSKYIHLLKWYIRHTNTPVSAEATIIFLKFSTVTAWFTWNVILSSASPWLHLSSRISWTFPLIVLRHVVSSLALEPPRNQRLVVSVIFRDPFHEELLKRNLVLTRCPESIHFNRQWLITPSYYSIYRVSLTSSFALVLLYTVL